MSRLKSWGLLYKLYTDDNNGYFNEGWGYSRHSQNAGKPGEYGLWMNALRPYYRDEKMRLCPTATREVEAGERLGHLQGVVYVIVPTGTRPAPRPPEALCRQLQRQ